MCAKAYCDFWVSRLLAVSTARADPDGTIALDGLEGHIYVDLFQSAAVAIDGISGMEKDAGPRTATNNVGESGFLLATSLSLID